VVQPGDDGEEQHSADRGVEHKRDYITAAALGVYNRKSAETWDTSLCGRGQNV
jgi:hypothetical protein